MAYLDYFRHLIYDPSIPKLFSHFLSENRYQIERNSLLFARLIVIEQIKEVLRHFWEYRKPFPLCCSFCWNRYCALLRAQASLYFSTVLLSVRKSHLKLLKLDKQNTWILKTSPSIWTLIQQYLHDINITFLYSSQQWSLFVHAFRVHLTSFLI